MSDSLKTQLRQLITDTSASPAAAKKRLAAVDSMEYEEMAMAVSDLSHYKRQQDGLEQAKATAFKVIDGVVARAQKRASAN